MEYIGNELELFAAALKWKQYYAKQLKPYIKGKVLDVGSGLGVNYTYLYNQTVREWFFLEPDAALLAASPTGTNTKKICGTIDDIEVTENFDTILYIDVLEHIEDDALEVEKALAKLRNNGQLIILCPALQWLYSPFDKAIGHYKRYSRKCFKTILPNEGTMVKSFYLDSASIPLSAANRFILKQHYPTKKQIQFWNNAIIPISKITDRLCGYHIGKTVIAIIQKK